MDHRFIVTAKVHSRKQFPTTTLREVQMLEDIYGMQYVIIDPQPIYAHNKIYTTKIFFPLNSLEYIKK